MAGMPAGVPASACKSLISTVLVTVFLYNAVPDSTRFPFVSHVALTSVSRGHATAILSANAPQKQQGEYPAEWDIGFLSSKNEAGCAPLPDEFGNPGIVKVTGEITGSHAG